MNENKLGVLATFAKHMVCPESLTANGSSGLSELGNRDYENYCFRHDSDLYRGDNEPEDILSKVIAALSRQLQPGKEVVLLLSDGKDSMTLALALSKMKVKCTTLTLLRDDDEEMRSYISKTCHSLGHTPHFVTVSSIVDSFDKEIFLSACKSMPHPVLDQGFLFFLFGLKVFFSESELEAKSCQFIDGLGNDESLGYLPSKMQERSLKLSKLGLWKLKPKFITELNWYLRSPAESHGDLSSLAGFFKIDSALDLNSYFGEVANKSDLIDFRAFSRGSFHDHQCMMEKTKVAAAYFESTIIFPWTDHDLSNFCFNIPINQKYDLKRGINKLPLRQLLEKELGWQQEKRGVDLYFDLDLEFFTGVIVLGMAPEWAFDKIINNCFLTDYVKKRAVLELINLSGYMRSKGYDFKDIESLLGKS